MSFRAVLIALQIGFLLCACAPPGPVSVSRPLEGPSEPITVGDTTRPGVRLDAGAWHVLPLSPLSIGRLELSVAPLGETVTSVEVRLRSRVLENDGVLVCAHDFDPDRASGWSDCRVDLPEAIGAPELVVRATSPAGGEVAVASPLHTSLGSVPKGPPIFLIVLDAARADAFSSFNPASPFGDQLAAFAQDGVRFTQARTSSPWTRPAVASVMTGLTPWRHGILDRRDSLGLQFETLAEKLAEAGYATHAYVTNPNLLPAFGFDQGFDVFLDLGSVAWKTAKVDAAPVFKRALAAVDSASGRPEFHWIHLMDPHTPYRPPDSALAVALRLGKKHHLPRKRANYNAEIVDVDRKIGAFLDDLRAAELYDRSLVVVVSDHGEAFFEHGVWGHGKQVFEESIRIPVVVKLPGGAHAGSVSELELGLEDVYRIVLDAALGEVAAEGGDDWLQNLQAVPQIAVLALGKHRKSAITEAGWKLIVDHASGEQELFNLAVDPREVADVSAANPARVRSMQLQLNTERGRGAAGLHLRWCGGEQASSVQMTVSLGERDVHSTELESTDTIERPEAGRLYLSFDLTPQANPLTEALERVGDLKSLKNLGRTFADQDEIRLTHPEGEPAELRAGVRLRVDSPSSWDVRFGESPVTQPDGNTIDLSDHALELLVSPDDPVACSLMPTERPLLHIWYIADPSKIDPDALSPDAIERLRALGYQW